MLFPHLRSLTILLLSLGLLAAPAVQADPKKNHKATKRAPPPRALTPVAPAYGEREDLMRFADELAAQEGWEAAPLRALLAQARRQATVQRLIMPAPAGTAKDWGAYRARFVEPRRIQAGLAFWSANEETLARAQTRFGVPAELIAGLIGVETFYGQIMGGFSVLDALSTLAFDFPPGRKDRSAFFREELVEFLKLCRREGLDPLAVKGSYAGAMGWPQFMPGSWNRHAIDFDGDGHVDLVKSPADAIGSVANYLARHGWQPGLPTHYNVAAPVETSERARLLAPDILPSFSAQQFAEAGAELSEAGREHPGPLALVELQMGDAAPVYVAGTSNFYALTRYNWSSYYAMAVIELGRTLRGYRDAATSSTTPPAQKP
ncbi:lytic murein transglycosylase B [Roseateles sp. DAIF2]|uniref:lytic murein transglycosylase B n=1 Tax=Roseateles sp. DAIF2 TaxID=2714952 RepID=UPI0018A2742D|nr:lytic murein transglycosylase B [Roseateles sp. DAIF2]QPF73352.1 lytic murein transglycosylase B [Roseateles sp. DAIF2]